MNNQFLLRNSPMHWQYSASLGSVLLCNHIFNTPVPVTCHVLFLARWKARPFLLCWRNTCSRSTAVVDQKPNPTHSPSAADTGGGKGGHSWKDRQTHISICTYDVLLLCQSIICLDSSVQGRLISYNIKTNYHYYTVMFWWKALAPDIHMDVLWPITINLEC